MSDSFRAGAASLRLEPPLGLPMVGFIRQPTNSGGYGLPLEVGALAFERAGTRVVLCGVDIVGIGEPEISVLLERVAQATGADPDGIGSIGVGMDCIAAGVLTGCRTGE